MKPAGQHGAATPHLLSPTTGKKQIAHYDIKKYVKLILLLYIGPVTAMKQPYFTSQIPHWQ